MPTTDLRHFDLQLRSETYQYRTPMKFGGRVVTDVTVLSADCEAQSGAGTAMGLGSMTMGVAWAWPEPTIDGDTKLAVVVELANRLARSYVDADQSGHPMDICHRHDSQRDQIARQLAAERGISSGIPKLAVLLAASPIEAALFDAHGKAAGVSSYSLLSREHLTNDLSHYLGDAYRGIYLDQLISQTPVDVLPLYHLVGALDPLTADDLDEPVGDGLPETLGDWIKRNELTHLKIKLNGDDLDWDVDRVARIYRVASGSRSGKWFFSLDFNERCDDEAYVLSLLDQLRSIEPDALECIEYIEQPTHRDLESHPEITMHGVAKQLPVVIDESLVDLQSLRTAIDQGYSGIALKACKGHAEALLLGAVAVHEDLFLCVQDLTCVGASLLHSASLAAHIPGVAAIESNGRQYSPAGNERWMDAFGEFFEVRGGAVPTSRLSGPGLGYGGDPALAQK
ncbi:MAG: mandelate racemase/muconate lactonizing enzyme family protein [Pirellulaceae bacterium]|nr:mandelate racemase/muconate lactonizing enzyme family protein [Pirellulaceae bacterium]